MLSSELRARLPGEVSLLTKQPGAKAINPQGLQRPRNLSALRKAMTLARFEYDHAPRPRRPSAWARNSAGPAVQFGATRNKRFVFLQKKKKRQRRRAPLAASQGWSCKGTGRPCPERSNRIERRFALAPAAHWVGLEPGLEGDYGLCFFPYLLSTTPIQPILEDPSHPFKRKTATRQRLYSCEDRRLGAGQPLEKPGDPDSLFSIQLLPKVTRIPF